MVSGVTSMEQWFAAKEPIKFGGVGPGGTASDIPRILHAALGLPIRVIDGYKGTADIRLVTEAVNWREAVLGWESLKTTWRKGIDSGEVIVVVQNMPKKHPELPSVPH